MRSTAIIGPLENTMSSIKQITTFSGWNRLAKHISEHLKAEPGTCRPAKILHFLATGLGVENANALKSLLHSDSSKRVSSYPTWMQLLISNNEFEYTEDFVLNDKCAKACNILIAHSIEYINENWEHLFIPLIIESIKDNKSVNFYERVYEQLCNFLYFETEAEDASDDELKIVLDGSNQNANEAYNIYLETQGFNPNKSFAYICEKISVIAFEEWYRDTMTQMCEYITFELNDWISEGKFTDIQERDMIVNDFHDACIGIVAAKVWKSI